MHEDQQVDDHYSLEQVPEAEAKKNRGLSCSNKEDELLCLAWLGTNVDLFHGADQRNLTFWQRVHDWFHENKYYDPY